jgi:hypothetical protein
VIVDAYCHCGISRYRPIEDVDVAMARAGVERAVLVQHLGELDNGYLESIAVARPDRFVAVGLFDYAHSDWSGMLDGIVAAGRLRGLRLTEEALSANFDFCGRAVKLGLVALLDLPSGVGRWVGTVERLADAAGGRPIVISHLGYPEIDAGRLVAGREILELADLGTVHVHASGFGMWCEQPFAAPAALAGEVVERFGAERVMWGSNFPESVDTETYRRELDVLLHLPALASAEDAAGVSGETARRVWFGDSADGSEE